MVKSIRSLGIPTLSSDSATRALSERAELTQKYCFVDLQKVDLFTVSDKDPSEPLPLTRAADVRSQTALSEKRKDSTRRVQYRLDLSLQLKVHHEQRAPSTTRNAAAPEMIPFNSGESSEDSRPARTSSTLRLIESVV